MPYRCVELVLSYFTCPDLGGSVPYSVEIGMSGAVFHRFAAAIWICMYFFGTGGSTGRA